MLLEGRDGRADGIAMVKLDRGGKRAVEVEDDDKYEE
jgi:hypothetical protein